jgi:hypothetical protein
LKLADQVYHEHFAGKESRPNLGVFIGQLIFFMVENIVSSVNEQEAEAHGQAQPN